MKKILLIEDHEDLRENTAEILSLSNYEVLKAEDGKEGLEMARKERPDLIICDIMMPVLDGYAVKNSLQKSPDLSDIPFIFLTALADKDDIRKGMRAGADDYLTKPFEGIELLKAVETCLSRKDRHQEALTRRPARDRAPSATGDTTADQPFDLTGKEIKEYRKKSLIYAEGQRPTNVFHILKGKVKTYIIHMDGKELITRIDGPGAFIGYTAMLEDVNYRDNAQVLEDAELILVPRQEFLQWMGSNGEIVRQFIRLLARNAAEKEEGLLNLAYNSLRKRVANGLLQVLDRFRTAGAGADAIDISRENLAHVIGSATESLTRTLSEFKEEKLIDIREGKIYLLNEGKLRNLVN